MNIADFDLVDLTPEVNLETFKCAESDLNEFLIDESKDYQAEFLAKTYLLINPANGDIVAYYSLLNDVIYTRKSHRLPLLDC